MLVNLHKLLNQSFKNSDKIGIIIKDIKKNINISLCKKEILININGLKIASTNINNIFSDMIKCKKVYFEKDTLIYKIDLLIIEI